MKLKDRVAIITGGQKGLGAAFTRRYLDEGAKVVIAARSRTPFVDELLAAGAAVSFIQTDVTRPDHCAAMVRHAVDKFGGVDILVNNAGFFANIVRQPIEDIPDDEIAQTFNVNVLGVFNCIKAVAPLMKARDYGKIINIGSATVVGGSSFQPHYVASKGAIFALTRAMARELGEHSITINTIAPGFTPTEGGLTNDHNKKIKEPELSSMVAGRRSIKREALPEDLNGLAVFLASADSDFMTGQMVVCDGGMAFH